MQKWSKLHDFGTAPCSLLRYTAQSPGSSLPLRAMRRARCSRPAAAMAARSSTPRLMPETTTVRTESSSLRWSSKSATRCTVGAARRRRSTTWGTKFSTQFGLSPKTMVRSSLPAAADSLARYRTKRRRCDGESSRTTKSVSNGGAQGRGSLPSGGARTDAWRARPLPESRGGSAASGASNVSVKTVWSCSKRMAHWPPNTAAHLCMIQAPCPADMDRAFPTASPLTPSSGLSWSRTPDSKMAAGSGCATSLAWPSPALFVTRMTTRCFSLAGNASACSCTGSPRAPYLPALDKALTRMKRRILESVGTESERGVACKAVTRADGLAAQATSITSTARRMGTYVPARTSDTTAEESTVSKVSCSVAATVDSVEASDKTCSSCCAAEAGRATACRSGKAGARGPPCTKSSPAEALALRLRSRGPGP
mmetsp:Transcript_11405/g.38088  ORF Transcript_11405/g.38088 Transcript_11405/m.38088 type:complete len:425 (-) Transcript_11405:61-1335(-)